MHKAEHRNINRPHKTPYLLPCHPPLPWQLSHGAPTPCFLPLMTVSMCHLGKPDIPSRSRGPSVNGSHWWAKKSSFVAPGAGVGTRLLTHSLPVAHTGRRLRTECQQRRSRDRSSKVPPARGNGREGWVRAEEGYWEEGEAEWERESDNDRVACWQWEREAERKG